MPSKWFSLARVPEPARQLSFTIVFLSQISIYQSLTGQTSSDGSAPVVSLAFPGFRILNIIKHMTQIRKAKPPVHGANETQSRIAKGKCCWLFPSDYQAVRLPNRIQKEL